MISYLVIIKSKNEKFVYYGKIVKYHPKRGSSRVSEVLWARNRSLKQAHFLIFFMIDKNCI